jgi:sugar O-acyltransferase (sialic acid O-acetyltransferase NeuD family)
MKLVLIGGGGHAKSCISCIESAGIDIAGILDARLGDVCGYQILGDDDLVGGLIAEGYDFFIAVGQIMCAEKRKAIYNRIVTAGGRLAVVVASDGLVARTASLGDGTIVMHKSVVNSDAIIGLNCIVNTGAIIEHDVVIADHTHISTGAIINGGCRIGEGTFIGSGAIVKNGVSICEGVVIGAGSLVLKDINEAGIYVGIPVSRLDSGTGAHVGGAQ